MIVPLGSWIEAKATEYSSEDGRKVSKAKYREQSLYLSTITSILAP